MNRITRFGARVACALSLLLSVVVPAQAAPTDLLAWREAQTLPNLITHLEIWLDSHSDFPRRENPPVVEFVSLAEALQLRGGAQASEAQTTRGLYDPETQRISLVRPWDPRNPHDVSVLLHELVHHRQNGEGHWYCPGAQEEDAYRLQDAWLSEFGLEANVNWIAVVLEAGCTPRDIHPD